MEGEHIDLDIQENVRIYNHVHIHIQMHVFSDLIFTYIYMDMYMCLRCVCVCVCVYPPSSQSTGWSAFHFAAERGDVTTTQSLLKAGANVLLKDKVCVSHNYLLSSSLFQPSTFLLFHTVVYGSGSNVVCGPTMYSHIIHVYM